MVIIIMQNTIEYMISKHNPSDNDGIDTSVIDNLWSSVTPLNIRTTEVERIRYVKIEL